MSRGAERAEVEDLDVGATGTERLGHGQRLVDLAAVGDDGDVGAAVV